MSETNNLTSSQLVEAIISNVKSRYWSRELPKNTTIKHADIKGTVEVMLIREIGGEREALAIAGQFPEKSDWEVTWVLKNPSAETVWGQGNFTFTYRRKHELIWALASFLANDAFSRIVPNQMDINEEWERAFKQAWAEDFTHLP